MMLLTHFYFMACLCFSKQCLQQSLVKRDDWFGTRLASVYNTHSPGMQNTPSITVTKIARFNTVWSLLCSVNRVQNGVKPKFHYADFYRNFPAGKVVDSNHKRWQIMKSWSFGKSRKVGVMEFGLYWTKLNCTGVVCFLTNWPMTQWARSNASQYALLANWSVRQQKVQLSLGKTHYSL